jgi:hypothetical protein
MGRMREPSLSLHGIEGAFYGSGAKTVIPAKVAGKFSIRYALLRAHATASADAMLARLVPPQTPDAVNPLVHKYLEAEFAKLRSKNTLRVECLHDGRPWVADHTHANFAAAARATKAVYGVDPDYTREGGSIPVTLTFAEALGVNVCLLPMGRGDDGAHSTNEKLDRDNYVKGVSAGACGTARARLMRVVTDEAPRDLPLRARRGEVVRSGLVAGDRMNRDISGRRADAGPDGCEVYVTVAVRRRKGNPIFFAIMGRNITQLMSLSFSHIIHVSSTHSLDVRATHDSSRSKNPTPPARTFARKPSYHLRTMASGTAASAPGASAANPAR